MVEYILTTGLFMLILAAIAIVTVAIVLLASCHISISDDRLYYNGRIAVLSFNQFLSYYKLNPSAYDLNGKYAPVRKAGEWSWENIIIHFNRFTDHLRYHFWRKHEIRNQQKRSPCTERYLKLVMDDIDKMRRLSAKEMEEAQQEIEKASSRMRSTN